jgi:hypothetical protein
MSATGEPPRNDLTGTWIVTALRGVTRFFRHDPRTGDFLHTENINRSIELAHDGQSFAVVSQITRFDPNGKPIGTPVTVRGSGKRMPVEPIPAEP